MLEPVRLVVSVCSNADIGVWRHTAHFVLQNIRADRYLLVVPDGQASEFRLVTPRQIEIGKDSDYGGHLKPLIAARLAGGRYENRVGWYLQQFIKLHALRSELPKGLGVIWDADTVPLRPLVFTDDEGRLLHRISDEENPPYFAMVERLLGIERQTSVSFVSQCIPTRGEWVEAMCNEIESRSGKRWDETILSLIDPEVGASFSEYETLGSYAFSRHRDEVRISSEWWLRAGSAYFRPFGILNRDYLRFLARTYAYAAFERDGTTSIARAIKGAVTAVRGIPL